MTGQPLVALDTSVNKSIDTRWETARETAEAAGQAVPARPVEATLRREEVKQALREVRTYLMPKCALQRQLYYMRRGCRKPADRTIRECVPAIHHLSLCLGELPPYDEENRWTEAEVVDTVYYGVPNSWKHQMMLHDYHPFEQTTTETVAFCERLEAAEGIHNEVFRNQNN